MARIDLRDAGWTWVGGVVLFAQNQKITGWIAESLSSTSPTTTRARCTSCYSSLQHSMKEDNFEYEQDPEDHRMASGASATYCRVCSQKKRNGMDSFTVALVQNSAGWLLCSLLFVLLFNIVSFWVPVRHLLQWCHVSLWLKNASILGEAHLP